MGNVIDKKDMFEEKRLTDFAKIFVNIYLNDGSEAAGIWAHVNIKEEDLALARALIRTEFESRGYSFPNTGENNNE